MASSVPQVSCHGVLCRPLVFEIAIGFSLEMRYVIWGYTPKWGFCSPTEGINWERGILFAHSWTSCGLLHPHNLSEINSITKQHVSRSRFQFLRNSKSQNLALVQSHSFTVCKGEQMEDFKIDWALSFLSAIYWAQQSWCNSPVVWNLCFNSEPFDRAERIAESQIFGRAA